jgi:hypothetical protein
MNIRPADFAGSWYPGNPVDCEKEIQSFLTRYRTTPSSERYPVGGIVPHAGWFFSGAIACAVVHSLTGKQPPDVILIYGMHLHHHSPAYIMTEGAWDTPFGPLQIHEAIAERMTEKFPFKIETASRYHQDNTIELQLPFIKYFFPETQILPMGVPPTDQAEQIGKAAAAIARDFGLSVRIIGSTDLTHYGSNYGFTTKGSRESALKWVKTVNDKQVIDAMLALDPARVIGEASAHQNACCSGAAAAAIASVKELGSSKADMIAYATSYEKSPGSSFVGYVGIVFTL